MDAQQSDLIAQFSAVTGADPRTAQTALDSSNWNLEDAVTLYFAGHDAEQDDRESTDEPTQPTAAGSSQAQTSASAPKRTTQGSQRPKQMTLQDLQRGNDDEDDEDDKNRDLFAGGEKSGLAVQNPNQGGGNNPIDHFRNIMNQAKANRERPGSENDELEPGRPSHFQGRAQTLGGDDVDSRVIEPSQHGTSQRERLPRVTRTLHLWADGVSIDDGPLFRFDNPANQDIMAQINQGRAPLSLLDVQPDQEVDLNLIPHKDENYVAPKKVYKPFGGSGQRLGSPTPGLASSSTATSTTGTPATQASGGSSGAAPSTGADESAPTLTLQIRLGDGSRLQARFNTTQTVGHVYEYVDRAGGSQRAYALMTTFPSKELDNRSQVLGEMSDFKRGGVVVQKWK